MQTPLPPAADKLPKVRCREIGVDDLQAVATLLASGFQGRSEAYWMRGLLRQAAREVPEGYPRFGFLLDCDGKTVGSLLLIYSERATGDANTIHCNLSSWYVEPRFRNYATLLTSLAQRNKHVSYFNVSPAPETLPIIQAQGFKPYCKGLFISLPILSTRLAEQRVEIWNPATGSHAGLSAQEQVLLTRHMNLGGLVLICRDDSSATPFIFTPLRARRGRLGLPAMQLIFCRDPADYATCAGALGRVLLRLGKPVVVQDANGPMAGVVGRFTQMRGKKFFKGPHAPRHCDLTDTEIVLYGS